MDSTVEYFPRSDNPIKEYHKRSISNVRYIPDNEQLFKSRKKPRITNDLNEKKKSSKKSSSKASEASNQSNELSKTVIENLSLNRLIEDTVIYGCLLEIAEFDLKFSITGGIIVTVPITNISTAYSNLIENFANENDDSSEIPTLFSIFKIGDYFPIRILQKKTCDKFGHIEVIGSINPKDIYQNNNIKTFQKLPTGYPIIAAVSSKEDYGYMMDLGVDNLKAFLPIKDLQEYSHSVDLSIGALIRCFIHQFNERSLTLTVNPKCSHFAIEEDHNPNIHFYSPGVKTKTTIISIHNSGLELSLPGGYKGFVPRYHINDDLSYLPMQIKLGLKISGQILYVHPHTKQICISLKNDLKRKRIKTLIESIRIGLILQNATVYAHSQFGNIIFKLPTDNYAIALKKNLFEPNQYDEDVAKNLYKIGSAHTVRIKKFHLFDNLIEISLRKSFIEREDISIDDISIGSIVEGSIKKYRPDGIYVKLGFGINGFIPNIHLIDAPILNIEKTRIKLFPISRKVKCRVLKMDQNSRIPKIALTAKKTLLNLNDKQMFADLKKITPKMSSTGVVCLINDKGILLEFFNRIRGFIPIKYLATYKIEQPDKVFQLGQLVRCSVISVDVESERLVCSLVDNENANKQLKVNLQIKNKDDSMNSKLKIGQILKKLKIISKIPMKGFDLTDEQEKIQVFLPMCHLSDDTFMSKMLFLSYNVNDIIEELMVFTKDSANVVFVTAKPVFLKKSYKLIMSESDISINVPFPAVVRHITSTGVFFECLNSQYGVIRKKQLQDGFYEDPRQLGLVRGQTIFVNPYDIASFELDHNNNCLKSFKFSMKLSYLIKPKDQIRIDILRNHLQEYNNLLKINQSNNDDSIKKLSKYSIGQVVTYVITKIENDFIMANVSLTGNKNETTVSGMAFKYTNFSDLSMSQMGNAIVCDIDFEKKCLILFIEPKPAKLIRLVNNFAKSNISKIKLGQSIKGTVIYIAKKYVLVVFGGHAPGLLAFIPTIVHYNDLRQIKNLYSIGQSYQFLIEYFNEDLAQIFATLNDEKSNVKKNATKQKATVTKPISNKLENKITSINALPRIEKFDWDIIDISKLNNKRKFDELKESDINNNTNIDENNDDDDNEYLDLISDSDDDDNIGENMKKRKTRDERNEEARLREASLRQKEQQLTDIDRTPEDEQDFEMAVVASPNSSLVWIKFMAFYLERNEIDKARQIGERALSKISFREDKERTNIWISLLNLENNYGDDSSMKILVDKAIKFNDPRTIYSRLAIIYDESNKKEKAEKIYNSMIKKFHSDYSVWIEYLLFLMKNDCADSARKLFQKSLSTLEKRCHIEVISKFAQMEFRYGDSEKGKTIFETLLASNSKRLDKWSIYIDMLIKYTLNDNDVDSLDFIRNIFERLLTLKFSAHKMQFIFKKYFDFESKYSGDNVEILENIKQKAAEYIELGLD